LTGRRTALLAEDAIAAFARDLIAIPTENPPGARYDECIAGLAAELEELAMDELLALAALATVS
jgi:acetylornithine deacetylase/succinyl-diaminopimelate desuccinylase-like protein